VRRGDKFSELLYGARTARGQCYCRKGLLVEPGARDGGVAMEIEPERG
jgi:hypothetical protein